MSEGGGGGLGRVLILLFFLAALCGITGLAAAMMLWPASSGVGGPVATPPVAVGPAPVAVAPGTPPAHVGAAVARIRQRGVLRVGMDTGEPPYTGTPPMYFPNAAGEPDGFDVVLARRLQAALGAGELKVVHAKYSGLEDLLADPAEKVDVVISGYSATDAPALAFSKPYLEYGLCLVVPTSSKVKTTADLFGKKIGIFDDDAAAEDVQKLVKGYTELVRLEDGYWDALVNGRFDAFLYDYPYTAAELNAWYRANPSRSGSVRIAQYNLTDSEYAVGVRAADADLLAVVNDTIDAWRASDDYAAAVKTYLKGGLAVEPPKEARVHVVAAGESLSLIAGRELGDVAKWEVLWKLNQDRFPNPHLIDVGDRVVLP